MDVWYQLVDGHGAPFRKTMSASEVSLAGNALILDLQEAVKGKDGSAFPNVLAAELRVFTNEQDARASTSDLPPDAEVPSTIDASRRLYVAIPDEAVPAPERRVWYQVVDVHGTPFKRMKKDAVALPANADVAQLKHAVRAQNESAFATVCASQLDVRDSNGVLACDSPVPASSCATPLLVVVPIQDEPGVQLSTYQLSELSYAHADRIKMKLGLWTRDFDIDETADNSVRGYTWLKDEENHAAQKRGYMAFLRAALTPLLQTKRFRLTNVADDESLLSIEDPRLPFGVVGTADVLLLERAQPNRLNMLAGIRLVIAVKKIVEAWHLPQALGQLTSSSLKANEGDYPMSLLTDLNDCWHFSWFNDHHELAQATLTHPKNAIDFILASMTNQDGDGSFAVPFLGQPLTKFKISDFVDIPRDDAMMGVDG